MKSAVLQSCCVGRHGLAERMVRETRRSSRGSVLVFAVTLLVLLFAIGVTFVIFVQQEAKATGEGLKGTYSDQVVESGLEHAKQVIRSAILENAVVSYDGLFVKNAPDYFQYQPEPALGQPPVNYLRFFSGFENESTVAGTLAATKANGIDHAWLSWHENADFCGTTKLAAVDSWPNYYTDSRLSHTAYPNGALTQYRKKSPEHADLALAFNLDGTLSDTTANYLDFFPPKVAGKPNPILPIKQRPMVDGPRGEYFVWIVDLDGKLNANPKTWGLRDPSNIVLPVVLGAPEKDIAKQIFKELTKFKLPLAVDPKNKYGGLFGSYFKDAERDGFISKLWAGPPSGKYFDIGAVSEQIGLPILVPNTTSPENQWDYLSARYGLERYFTVYQDDDLAWSSYDAHESFINDNKRPMYLKESAAGLNINTASFEVLLAVLSQVPLKRHATLPEDVPDMVIANLLAERILAKRPFVCRMDFEDFLAAHLVESTTLSIEKAILKRDYTKLSLAQIMEMDGLPDTNTKYNFLRIPAKVKDRFEWFGKELDNTGVEIDLLPEHRISLKAFNNVLNSISGRLPRIPVKVEAGSILLNGHSLVEDSTIPNSVTFETLTGKFPETMPGLVAGTTYFLKLVSVGDPSKFDVYSDFELINKVPGILPGVGNLYIARYGYSFYSYDSSGLRKPFATGNVIPKFEYPKFVELPMEDLPNNLVGVDPAFPLGYTIGAGNNGDLLNWRATNQTGYYELAFDEKVDKQEIAFGAVVPGIPTDVVRVVLGDGVSHTPLGPNSSPALDGVSIVVNGGDVCDSFVHGPLRAYRHNKDILEEAPTVKFSNPVGGDVAWSPRFSFRSRFFKIYVMGRAIIHENDNTGERSFGPFRRSEITYDALMDKVLSRREQLTEMRSLGDPDP